MYLHTFSVLFIKKTWRGHAQQPSAKYSDSLKPLSVLHSGLKREWQPIFSTFLWAKKIQIFFFNKSFFMQLFCAVAKKNFFAYKNLKKPPSKVTQTNSNPPFFPYPPFFPHCLGCPNSPNR